MLLMAGSGFASCGAPDQAPAPDPTPDDITPDTTAPASAAPVTTAASTAAQTQPQKSEPEEYTTLMNNLDSFPIVFKYDENEYSGFAGFTEESRTTVPIDRGSETTVLLRKDGINAVFELVTRVFPEESAY